ncbi:hypothetical protein RHOSPDRAFT_37192 [Rhodotorula sp. JG-1b]|nr:hypothetical protein RHOSPDRAFT_37192 [Rhodotorula sp. JG-1b]
MPVLVAVGCSSSLGGLALQRFLRDTTTECWTVYAAHRSHPDPPHLVDTRGRHRVEWIPLELESLASVKRFAQRVTPSRVDLLWLNAATWDGTPRVIQLGQAAWTREAVVNCIAQHYLVHLLADKLACPLPNSSPEEEEEEDGDCVVERARIVWTTSNLHKSIPTLAATPPPLNDGIQSPPEEEEEQNTTTLTTPVTPKQRYAASKAAQLLSAFYWRRHFSLLEREQRLADTAREEEEEEEGEEECSSSTGKGSKGKSGRRTRPVDVVAVSPGFVPATNLSRDSNWFVRWLMRHVVGWFPFAVSVEEGLWTPSPLGHFPSLSVVL